MDRTLETFFHGSRTEFAAQKHPVNLARNMYVRRRCSMLSVLRRQTSRQTKLGVAFNHFYRARWYFPLTSSDPPRKSSAMGNVQLHPEKVKLQIHEPSPSLARFSFGHLHLTLQSNTALELRVHCSLGQYAMDKDRDAERADSAALYSVLNVLDALQTRDSFPHQSDSSTVPRVPG